MKRAFVLLSFTMICHAMETSKSPEPLTPRSFRAAFFEIKSHFESIKDACKNQTDQSKITVDAAITALHASPHLELKHILWAKHYYFSIGKQFEQQSKANDDDLALLHNDRLKYLLKFDIQCLTRAHETVMETKKLTYDLWNHVMKIECNKPPYETSISDRFEALQKKFQSLSNKVFESSPAAIEVLESIEQDLHTMCAVFLPILMEPRIAQLAQQGVTNSQQSLFGYRIALLLKQKIDEFQEKVNQIKD